MSRQHLQLPGLPPLILASRAQNEYAGACPFCGGDHRSDRFRVWPDANRYWCRRCNAHGRLDSLHGADLPQRIALPPRERRSAAPPANPAHIGAYRQLYAAVALWAHLNLQAAHNPEPAAYLRTRGATPETINHALLGYALQNPESLPDYLRANHPELLAVAETGGVLVRSRGHLLAHPNLRGALVFPYLADGLVTDLRTRTFPGKGYRSLAGSYADRGATALFGWDSLGDTDAVIVTEGEFKALITTQYHTAGQLSVPALAHPGLSYWRAEWGAQLRERGISTVYLAYDSQPRRLHDGAPQLSPEEIYTIRHGMRLAADGLTVRVLRLPLAHADAKSDLDAFLLSAGPAALERLLAATPDLADYHAGLPRHLLSAARLPTGPAFPRQRRRPVRTPDTTATPPPAPAEQLAAARTAIPHLVKQHAAAGSGTLILAHPPGAGKGHGAVAGLRDYLRTDQAPGQIVWTALRNNQVADQRGLELIPLHGRNAGNCQKLGEAQTLAARGYPVREALCMRRCPHVNHCAYLQQFRQDADFFASQQLLQSLGWWERAGVLVLDEFDPGQLIQKITLDSRDLAAMAAATTDPNARHILHWLGGTLIDSGNRALRGATLLNELHEAAARSGISFSDTLHRAISALPAADTIALLKGLPNNARLADYQALPPGHLPALLNQLARENRRLLSGRTFTSRFELINGALTMLLRRDWLLAQLDRPEQPKIILDATVTPALIRALLPHSPITLEQPPIPIPGRIRQVIRADWAKSTLHGRRREAWYDQVAAVIRPERHTLVVCTKACVDDLRTALRARGLNNIVVGHYGGLRGSNGYKGYDVVLAQAYHPNPEALVLEGRALFADDPQPLDPQIIVEERTLTAGTGENWTIPVTTFRDQRLAALLAQRREAEMVQCALRGRPFDYPDAQITLLFTLPLPGLQPSEIVVPTPGPDSNGGRQAATTLRLIAGAQALLAAGETRLSVQHLAQAAGASVVTVRAHWHTVAAALQLTPGEEHVQHRGKRIYTRAVLMAAAPDSASESRKSTDQAHNKDSLMRLICAQPAEGLPGAVDTAVAPDPDPSAAPEDCRTHQYWCSPLLFTRHAAHNDPLYRIPDRAVLRRFTTERTGLPDAEIALTGLIGKRYSALFYWSYTLAALTLGAAGGIDVFAASERRRRRRQRGLRRVRARRRCILQACSSIRGPPLHT